MALELLDAGENVVVIDNLSTGLPSAVPSKAELVRGDVGNRLLVESVIAQHDVDAVMHFAGSVVVPNSMADPLGSTTPARALISCVIEKRVKHFIFSSTAAVNGIPDANPVSEQAPTRPISPTAILSS
jgi:UDP-glucose 4-epimerase